ncbi:aminoglycoside phosphotransferase family protein [Ideonella sp. BN130291]|uniref:aminoglycoside phosphotransferase family protein n=1 Tax=Ideonella sp. BN130291 TaxID=3112940 RepID=UPI002E25D2D3|nr:phosphotransferase [Ideonella sp. BN130291]
MSASAPSPTAVTWADPARQAAFERWLAPIAQARGLRLDTLQPASADASFRRYLRVQSAQASFIVMDAPPPQEDVRPFVHIAGLIQHAGLHAPEILECDAGQGFLLLSDLGNALYLDQLREASSAQADRLMRDAVQALVRFQQAVDPATLPPYDAALLQRELDLFPDWCVAREFNVTWTDAQRSQWQRVCQLLIDSALAQPTVAVHRDYMPRNLMVADPNPGILDFQDAVRGPITYDVASLLRDAFLSWDEEREIDWAVRYWEQARRVGLPVGEDFGEFWRALEWMGLQRHLKVLGIFCRLKHRDGKARYAQDLPRFFAYATKVALRYRPLQPLLPLIEPLSGATVQAGYTF